MTWVVIGHGYSLFGGQIFSSNWTVSLGNIFSLIHGKDESSFDDTREKKFTSRPHFYDAQTQFGDPNNGFLSSGAFAVIANEFVSVDSFFLIGDQNPTNKS